MRLLTFDIDWAPDWIVEDIALRLIAKRVKATFFITHNSPVLNFLRTYSDLFELGIHPNLLPGSTHGKTEAEIMNGIKKIVPEAETMRTHGLYQSSNFLIAANAKYGIKIDASILMPDIHNIQYHFLKCENAKLFRVPYNWEDDIEFFSDCPRWSVESFNSNADLIFDFHPIHIALNSSGPGSYRNLKNMEPNSAKWTKKMLRTLVNDGKGAGSLLDELLDVMQGQGLRVKDLYPGELA